MEKWNWQTHRYEPYIVPKNWNTPLYTLDFNEKVNCVQCGKEIEFGDAMTSLEVHSEHGFGYMVCEECNEKEWERRRGANANT